MIHANGAVPDASRAQERTEDVLEDALNQHEGGWVAVENDRVIDNDEKLDKLVGRLNGQAATAAIFWVEPGPTSTS